MKEENNKKLMKGDEIHDVEIYKLTKSDMSEYGVYVTTNRAIPHIKDGLKPVARRILQASYDMGLMKNPKFTKSAKVVGQTMGSYHPHGDSSIYEAGVMMLQPFNTRYPMLIMQGNSGNVDGSKAAASRYTEMKPAKITSSILGAFGKNITPTVDNYDATTNEALYFPTTLPLLLAQGTNGIAVGVSTNILPHNMTELLNASKLLINKPDSTLDEVLEIIKAPDFPVGSTIINPEVLREIYETGKSKTGVKVRANIDILKDERILKITQMPYQVKTESFKEQLSKIPKKAETFKAYKTQYEAYKGMTNVEDYSDKNGIDIRITYSKKANPEILREILYKETSLEKSYSVDMMAYDTIKEEDGRTQGFIRRYSLMELLHTYINHLRKITVDEHKHDKKVEEKKARKLEIIINAAKNITKVTQIIKDTTVDSKNMTYEETNRAINAKIDELLAAELNINLNETDMVKNMPISKSRPLTIKKMEEDLTLIQERIIGLQTVIENPTPTMLNIIDKNIKDYGDERRTEVKKLVGVSDEDLIMKEEVIITLSKGGYISNHKADDIKTQNLGGTGTTLTKVEKGDEIIKVIKTHSHNDLLLFTNKNKVYKMKVFEVSRTKSGFGVYINNLLEKLTDGEKVIEIFALSKDSYNNENYDIITYTKRGMIKRSKLSNYEKVKKAGTSSSKVKNGDELLGVRIINQNYKLFMTTKNGLSTRFDILSQFNRTGITAAGVSGMKVGKEDELISVIALKENDKIFIITEKSKGKITPQEGFALKNRNGKGMKSIDLDSKDKVSYTINVSQNKETLSLSTRKGNVLQFKTSTLSKDSSRTTKGKKISKLKVGDKIISIN